MGNVNRQYGPRLFMVLAAAITSLLLVASARAGLVISQVYGGGGNSLAPYANDFVELFNDGPTALSLSGLSIQYASATGTGNFGFNSTALTPLPSVFLQPWHYFLIEEASNNLSVGIPLPSPDATDPSPINLSATAGKVALVVGTSSLGCNGSPVNTPCSAAQLALILDLVGYGTGASTGANFFEGTGAAPTLTNTTADFRLMGGLQDTNDNSADFSRAAPNPRNTSSPANVPEPGTIALLALGLAGFGLASRKRYLSQPQHCS